MNVTQTEPAIRIRGLDKTFVQGGFRSRREVKALNSVDLEVGRGEIVALVGESGSGKSTLARCIARLETPDDGVMEVLGEDVLRTQRRRASKAYRSDVQMVFQDPFGSLNPTQRVEHVLARSLHLHGKARKDLRAQLVELVESVGLPAEVLSSFPHEMSGGQRQRIAIARVLAVEPKVILADEPTSMLDVSVRIGVLNLLSKLRDERGIAILYVTHDLASARYLADRILVMHRGTLVEGGESLALLDSPQHPYTRMLVGAVPDPERTIPFDPEERRLFRTEIEAWADAPSARVLVDHESGHWVWKPKETTPHA
ncbi:ATP-binding cassette domain-containing protein [Microbacterium oryzae]|uniref:ABC transporter ATP-binding protein n=1 Tax=Microbacterium oryzae TaxID=743009 RepID=A0A6I6DTQ1_9MICO|nr:ATP-binding cassette domain-containing protein [Microbacterium oryzae]QGU28355.1 ABC transporter ATP-binding protein [Microbacterium oryzae]